MVHEISQFDIPDRKLLAGKVQPGAGMRSDIGEAKVIKTVFGRPRVRVVRERDKKRRAWLIGTLAVLAVAAAGWQGWIALQQSELLAPQLPLSERIKVSAPVFQPEEIPSLPESTRNRQKTLTEMVLDGMATRRPPPPSQPLKPQTVAKPLAQALTASKQPIAPLDGNSGASNDQMDMQQAPRLSDPMLSAAQAVAPPPAVQPAPARPAAITQPAVPSPASSQAPGAAGVQPASPQSGAQP